MDVPLKEPLTKEWFGKYAAKRDLELILSTAENAAHHLLCMKFSGVTPALNVRSTDADGQPFIAIMYKRPERDNAADAAASQRFAS